MGFLSDALSTVSTVGGLINGFQTNNMLANQYATSVDLAKNRHQYEVADLKKAGLNPILSANSGAVALPQSNAGQRVNPWERAMQVATSAAQLEQIKSATEKQKADANLANEQADSQQWQRRLIDAEILKSQIEGMNMFSEMSMREHSIKNIDADTQKKLYDAELAFKDLQTYDQRFAADLNLKQAQLEYYVAAGEMSRAAAANQYAMAVESGVRQGLISEQKANAIKEGQRIVIENQKADIELRKMQATEEFDTSKPIQTFGKFFHAVTGGLGSLVGLGPIAGLSYR